MMETKFSIDEECYQFGSVEEALDAAYSEEYACPVTVYEQTFEEKDLSSVIKSGRVYDFICDEVYNLVSIDEEANDYVKPMNEEIENKFKELLNSIQVRKMWFPVGDVITHEFSEYPKDGE